MAWIQVDKQTYNGTWGTAPPINLIWEATAYRDDVTNDLRITYTQSAKYVSGYFGYNIIGGAWVINDSHLQSKTLKGNTPNTWGTVSVTYEWNLGTITDSTVLCALSYSTNSGRDAAHLRLTLNTPMYEVGGGEDDDEGESGGTITDPITGEPSIGIQLKHNKKDVYPITYFPIGAIFICTTDINPASLYIGDWERIEERFLVGAGDLYAVGSKGGEENVTLTIATMPSHKHEVYAHYGNDGSSYGKFHQMGKTSTSYPDQSKNTVSVGSNLPHNNMPPYRVVHIWRRVA